MEKFHALVIINSLTKAEIFSDYKLLSKKTDGSWLIFKLELNNDNIDRFIKDIQRNLKEDQGWYTHLYNQDGSKLIIIFKNKVFHTNSLRDNWQDAIKYGVSIRIPIEQLDFRPNNFENEKY
ncbi:MAG: hypothetical protein WCP14_02765 [bacterium]